VRVIAILLTAIAVLALMATVGQGYAAAWTHGDLSHQLGTSAFLTLILTLAVGFMAFSAWMAYGDQRNSD
jgi:cytochrome bd-type quinol oxidase subunit 2